MTLTTTRFPLQGSLSNHTFINIAQDTPVFYKRGRNGRPALAGMIFGVFLFSLLC
ncbi:hypothetical protein [Paenibacillus sp. PL2-23]|uniref:hypothetical protein n=1 Tax=Paenibacillus sp. PL2-23 TaxID=2100729 RepID=UPI00349ED738